MRALAVEAEALRATAWATYDACTAPHLLLDLPDTDVSGARALEWTVALTESWEDEYPFRCGGGNGTWAWM